MSEALEARIRALAERWGKTAEDNRRIANRSGIGVREYYDAQVEKYHFFANELLALLDEPEAATRHIMGTTPDEAVDRGRE